MSTPLLLEILEDRTLMSAAIGAVDGLNHPEAILRLDFGPLGGGRPTDPRQTPSFGKTPPNVLVNNPGEDGSSTHFTQSETGLVLGSGNTVVAGYNDSFLYASGHFTGYSVSTDGGQTFTDKLAPPASSSGDAGDPVLARDNTTGRIYLTTLGYYNSSLIQVFHSDDNGATFSAPVNGVPGTGYADKEWITVDNNSGTGQGNVYLVVRDFASKNGIYLYRSTDHGLSFSAPTGSTIVTAGSGNVQGAWVTVGPDHAVYAFWYDNTTSPARIMMRKSTDQGNSFAAAVTVATLSSSLGGNGDLGLGFRSNAFPQAVVNPANPNNIYVTFDNRGAGSQRADVFFTQSTNGGSTWSTPKSVTDDTTTRDKWQPSIAVTPDGTHLGIFWYDRRNDPANNMIDRYGVIGTISGSNVTFAANMRVSDQSFPPSYGHDSVVVSTYMGDYDQMTATNTNFYVTWGDNRLVQAGFNNPDVRFALVPIGTVTGDHFGITAPASVNAGQPFSFTVQALDPNGNLDPNYQGAVTLSSSDSQAQMPTHYTFTSADGGQHTFPRMDLFTGGNQSLTATDGTVYGSVTINVVAPTSGFYPPVNYGTGSGPTNAVVADFTGSGIQDIATANDGSGANSISVLLGNGDGTFKPAVNYAAGVGPNAISAGDLVGNGIQDLVSANYGGTVSVFLGNGNGTFKPAVNYSDPGGPSSVALADLLGNGILDIVVANNTSANVAVFLGNGNGTFQAAKTYAAGSGPVEVAVGDYNQDGIPDLAVVNQTSNNVSILFGNGNGTFQAPVNYAVGSGPLSVAAGDFTGTGILSLATANSGSNTVSILLGNGNGTFKPATSIAVGTNPTEVNANDFNGDGIVDLVTANDGFNHGGNTVSVLLGNGNGTFRTPMTFTTGTGPFFVTSGDLNGDGMPDLVTANFISNGISVLLNAGNWPPSAGPEVSLGDLRQTVLQNPQPDAPVSAAAPAASTDLAGVDGFFATGFVPNQSQATALDWFAGAALQPVAADNLLTA